MAVCDFSVFWDLYCAAPERRETCDHSSEAKAFHDYGFVNSGYSVNGIPHVRLVLNNTFVYIILTNFMCNALTGNTMDVVTAPGWTNA